jgi:HAD superfamily hydrolase (TIGR01549 family)
VKKSKLYLFDMDGVLFNTKLNMKKSWNNVRKKFKLQIKFENYFGHIGIPFEKILENLKIYKDIKKIKNYYQDQSIRHQNLVKIYPGVSLTINKLLEKGHAVGVVTSKDYKRTKKLIKKYKLKFSVIQCPTVNLRGKPYPDTILNAISQTKFKKKDVVYVGDTNNDFLSARRAKINFIYANYGYGKINVKKVHCISKIIDLVHK